MAEQSSNLACESNRKAEVSELLGRVISRASVPAREPANRPPTTPDDHPKPPHGDGRKWELPGISGATHVTTNFGKVPAQLVRVGDHLKSRSGHYRPVLHIRETKLDSDFFVRHPEAKPVLVKRGSVGNGCPAQDVLLSPAQAVTVSAIAASPIATQARELSQSFQSVDKTLGMVAYYEFELDCPDDICCEGLWVKSRAN